MAIVDDLEEAGTRERITADSRAFELIAEQEQCVCGHLKAEHVHKPPPNHYACSHGISDTWSGVRVGCRCEEFLQDDWPMTFLGFTKRILGPEKPCPGCQHPAHTKKCAETLPYAICGCRDVAPPPAGAALRHALHAYAVDLRQPRRWHEWLSASVRAWKGWNEAGRPFRAFGKDLRYGEVRIPALD